MGRKYAENPYKFRRNDIIGKTPNSILSDHTSSVCSGLFRGYNDAIYDTFAERNACMEKGCEVWLPVFKKLLNHGITLNTRNTERTDF